ncbi:MAG: hypothetical protein KA978_00185 [Deltaproteobacteria bacterium]|nr:hypothetical protein [Deltaproteobacteria bacterium]MBP6829163.1 hypothetical protein [Deltaproteobacteria bacterium]
MLALSALRPRPTLGQGAVAAPVPTPEGDLRAPDAAERDAIEAEIERHERRRTMAFRGRVRPYLEGTLGFVPRRSGTAGVVAIDQQGGTAVGLSAGVRYALGMRVDVQASVGVLGPVSVRSTARTSGDFCVGELAEAVEAEARSTALLHLGVGARLRPFSRLTNYLGVGLRMGLQVDGVADRIANRCVEGWTGREVSREEHTIGGTALLFTLDAAFELGFQFCARDRCDFGFRFLLGQSGRREELAAGGELYLGVALW